MSLSNIARNLFKPFLTRPIPSKEGLRHFLKEAIPLCPLCGNAMDGHCYQQMASLSFTEGDSSKLTDFLKAYELSWWDGLAQFQEWNGTLNNAVAWFFQCSDGRYYVAIVYDPYELWDSVLLLRYKEVDGSELTPRWNEWQQI